MAKVKTDPSKISSVETRSPEEVWRAIEEDLRRDLRPAGAPRAHRTGWLVALVAGVVALVAGSFILGWNLAPEPAPKAAPAVTAPAVPFTETGLASKHAGLGARYGSEFGEAVTAPAVVNTGGAPFSRSGLASKREALVARYGAEFGRTEVSTPTTEGAAIVQAHQRSGLELRYGSEFGNA